MVSWGSVTCIVEQVLRVLLRAFVTGFAVKTGGVIPQVNWLRYCILFLCSLSQDQCPPEGTLGAAPLDYRMPVLYPAFSPNSIWGMILMCLLRLQLGAQMQCHLLLVLPLARCTDWDGEGHPPDHLGPCSWWVRQHVTDEPAVQQGSEACHAATDTEQEACHPPCLEEARTMITIVSWSQCYLEFAGMWNHWLGWRWWHRHQVCWRPSPGIHLLY